MLAKIYPHSVGYIRDHADQFGLVKKGHRWVAFKKDVKKAHGECCITSQRPDIGTLSSSTVDDSFESPLARLIREKRSTLKLNCGDDY